MAGEKATVSWETCIRDYCIGVRLGSDDQCFVDTGDTNAKRLALHALRRDGVLVFTRGLAVSAEALKEILWYAPTGGSAVPYLIRAEFNNATFGNGCSFRGIRFGDEASFANATFADNASFGNATFGSGAVFAKAAFGKDASFADATFGNGAIFNGATFGSDAVFGHTRFGDDAFFTDASFGEEAFFGDASFGDRTFFAGTAFGNDVTFGYVTFGHRSSFVDATFGDRAMFGGAAFGDNATFASATFGDESLFDLATFGNGSVFGDTRFGDDASFDMTTFEGEVTFLGAVFGDGTSFHRAVVGERALFEMTVFGSRLSLGPMFVSEELRLRGAELGPGPQVAVSAERLDLTNVRSPDGGAFDIHGAEVNLDGADFARHTVFGGVDRLPSGDEISIPLALVPKYEQRARIFRVASMRRCDLREVVFSNVDLRRCRFTGAVGLDQLGLEPPALFLATPSGFKAGRALPPLWRWSRRTYVIAEEHEWRAAQRKASGWNGDACATKTDAAMDRVRAAQLAEVYRSLRKGREDRKDEPGAADFYYGEMEMRRHAAPPFSAERLVLWLYWITSGYGLRAGRALGLLAALLVVFAWLFDQHGFTKDETFWRALTYSAGSATAIFGGLERQLTTWGEAFRIAVRALGPILLALAVLSLRGRVKR